MWKRGRELRTLEGHAGCVNGVALSADGRRAVSASCDKTLKVWDVETRPRTAHAQGPLWLGQWRGVERGRAACRFRLL